uniref:Capsid protein n=1 Tax=Genomoviridae sp. TaxID=2202565 RepID=A0A858NE26_9VIRU|nr:MAG: capsid protein [Genomoviridae sp.]
MARFKRNRAGRPIRFGGRRRTKFPTPAARVARKAVAAAHRRRFTNRVTKIIKKNQETFKQHFTQTTFSLAPGNGTTGMNFRVFAPWQALLGQGDTTQNFTGQEIRLIAFNWRIMMTGLVAGDVHVQIIFFKSDFQMDTTVAGTDVNNEGQTMTPATTTTTIPTQVAPNGNIPLFDITATGQFSGASPVTPWNNDNISIIKVRNYKLHSMGVATTDPFHVATLKFKFNKVVKIQETQGTIDGIPRFFGPRNKKSADQYYIGVRVWTQDPISATSAASFTHTGKLFWKEF